MNSFPIETNVCAPDGMLHSTRSMNNLHENLNTMYASLAIPLRVRIKLP